MNTQRRRRLLKYGPSVYVVKCRFSMNSLSVPFERRSLWTAPNYNYSMNARRQTLRIKPKISVRFWVVMNEEILPQCATLQARAELPRPTEEWADGWQILAFGVTHFSWTERKNVSHKGKNWLCVPSIHNVQVCGNTRYFIAKLEGFIVFVTDIIGWCM